MSIFSLSGNYGKNVTRSSSQQNVWGGQAPWLTQMYGDASGLAGQQAGDMGGIQDYFSQLQGAAMPAFQNLSMGPQNPWLQGMADTAMGSVARNFQNQIMPSITGAANMAGQRGGAREGLYGDYAAGEAGRAMGDVAQNIYGQAWNQGMQGQLGALGQLGNLGNLGMGGMQAAWMPYQNLANILGGPTVLGSSTSQSRGSNMGLSVGGGQ